MKEALSLRELHDERASQIGRLANWVEPHDRLAKMVEFSVFAVEPSRHDEDLETVMRDLNAALAIFAPRIEVHNFKPQQLTIYNAVAAQFANDIFAGAPLMTCNNETCKRTFTKQRGRAEYGAHRTKGVLYCSNTCAKAQAQRELRRRNRKAKNGA